MHKYNEVQLRKNAKAIRERLDKVSNILQSIPDGEENDCFHAMQKMETHIRTIRAIHSQNKGIKVADKNWSDEGAKNETQPAEA
jgi:hypothetical protein